MLHGSLWDVIDGIAQVHESVCFRYAMYCFSCGRLALCLSCNRYHTCMQPPGILSLVMMVIVSKILILGIQIGISISNLGRPPPPLLTQICIGKASYTNCWSQPCCRHHFSCTEVALTATPLTEDVLYFRRRGSINLQTPIHI